MAVEDARRAIAAIADSVVPAAHERAAAVRARLELDLAPAGAAPASVELAARLAAAQHLSSPRLEQACVLVCAADHGLAGESARAPLRRLTQGHGPLMTAMRMAGEATRTSLALVDCGLRPPVSATADPDPSAPDPDGVIELGLGAGTADIRVAAAMSPAQAAAAVHTGIALLLSLAEGGLDVLALGQVAPAAVPGARAVSGAVVAALIDAGPGLDELDRDDRAAVAAALERHRPDPDDPLAVLAALGGFDLGVLAGAMLAAASIRVPIVLDDHGTAAAAVLAARWQPALPGYLCAAHAGTARAHRLALRALGLTPLFDQAVAHGDGAGAALALAPLAEAARLVRGL
ncbi:nicotinate-nucleotide--dimethylbenzimidazole phosphoribosyltransferase [Haliangium sp.]|uniref:nicotinate-nucleotide--dimethylbenzimidazole phosphoribosyltransferase n=1 Tax=Haliangium sp. TaxID=2663208 RepID=UPI003D0D0184